MFYGRYEAAEAISTKTTTIESAEKKKKTINRQLKASVEYISYTQIDISNMSNKFFKAILQMHVSTDHAHRSFLPTYHSIFSAMLALLFLFIRDNILRVF